MSCLANASCTHRLAMSAPVVPPCHAHRAVRILVLCCLHSHLHPFPSLSHSPSLCLHVSCVLYSRMVNLVLLRPKLMAYYALESADNFFWVPFLLFCGWAVGSLHASTMMDRVGRKRVLYISLALASASSSLSCLCFAGTWGYRLFAASQLVSGYGLGGTLEAAYLLMAESCQRKERGRVTIIM